MRHYHVDGHIYYITIVIHNRLHLFTRSAYVLPLLDSLNFYRAKYTFKLIGFVIMPDHLHLLVFPTNASQIADFMRDFKKFTAIRLIRQAEVEQASELLDAFAKAGNETGLAEQKVWQSGYWDMNIFSEQFLRQKLNYIHRNPVRAGFVSNPASYPYSSYRNYVADDHSLIDIDTGWR